MKLSLAKLVGTGLARFSRALTLPFGRMVGTRAAAHAAATLAPTVTIQTPKGPIRFWCASSVSAKRAVSFLRHEPDTRDWIDAHIKAGDHLWDVGANMGAYTLYACLNEGVTVTAFEPVPATFAMLAHNIGLNGLSARVTPLCLALSSKTEITTLFLSSPDAGSAMHAVGKAETVRGPFHAKGAMNIPAICGDDLVKQFGVHKPDHIKIDVDGHELAVLEGMQGILSTARTLWIEMIAAADQSGENARITEFLRGLGYEVKSLASERAGRNRLFVNRARQ